MNIKNCAAITRFAWLEFRRARLWVPALVLIAVTAFIADFAASIAVTEASAYRIVIYAAIVRFGAVFVVSLIVAASVLRELDDKGLELILSRPVSRADWYVGRFIAYASAAVALSILVSLPLALQVPGYTAGWCYSLALELLIVVAATLAASITLRQIPVALSFFAAVYLLGRGITAIALMSTGPTVDLGTAASRVIALFVEGRAYVLPPLDRFTHAEWLIGALPSAAEFIFLTMQSVVYTALLVAAGLFDLYRRNF
jgi:ABC-type Na+ efflux pump permease subunit